MDNLLKNKLIDYDAGFDDSAWDAIQDRIQENNSSTVSLKNSLSGYDAGFNQNAWVNISGKIAQNNLAFQTQLLTKRIAGAAIVISVLVSSFIGYNFLNNYAEGKIANKNIEPETQNASLTLMPEEKQEKNSQITEENSKIEKETNESKAEVEENPELLNAVFPAKTPSILAPTIVKSKPQLTKLYLAKNEICLGEHLNAKILNNANKNYQVKISNKWIEVSKLSNYKLNKAGKHTIELYEVGPNKKLTTIEMINVFVHDKSNAKFDYEKEKIDDIPVTNFKANGSELTSSKWYVGNKLIGSSQTINYTFVNKGKYPVKLVTCNANGCKDSSTQMVRILKAYNLLATQIFNPKTETWLPLGLKKSESEFEIRIVSTEGETAFESSSPKKEWNGIIEESGKKAKDGDEFYWVAKVKNQEGKFHEYGGSFIISSVFN